MKDWRIYIALIPDEERAILDALVSTYPFDRFSTVTWIQADGINGTPELLLDVAAATEKGALAEAARVFQAPPGRMRTCRTKSRDSPATAFPRS